MATFFKNTISTGVGTVPTAVASTASNSRATVIGLSLTNLTLGAIQVSVQIQIPGNPDPVLGYYCKDVLVPPNTSLRLVNGGEKLILGNENILYISCNAEAGLDVLVSYVEII